TRGDCRSKRLYGKGWLVVAGDCPQDPSSSGARDALSSPDYLPCRLCRCESALSKRRVPRSVWRRKDLLLQLGDTALSEGAAARGGDGTMRCRRCLSSCSLGLHHYGRRQRLYGFGRPKPRKGRGGSSS